MSTENKMQGRTKQTAKDGQNKLRNNQPQTPSGDLFINHNHNARKEPLGPNTKR